jgi:hypothetical protein
MQVSILHHIYVIILSKQLKYYTEFGIDTSHKPLTGENTSRKIK